MDEIGFIGLRAMGTPMTWNIHNAGYSLRVYNRTIEKAEPFESEGVTVCSSPADTAENADTVIVMVVGSNALMNILRDADDAVVEAAEDTTVINMSTVSHETTVGAAELVTEYVVFVDTPVPGTVGTAEEGTLTVLAAGDEVIIDSIEPLLETMGNPVIYCGDVGQGTNMKLCINLLLGGMMQSFVEALVFGEKHDLGLSEMLDVIDSGGLGAPLFQAKGESIRNGDFNPDFSVNLLFKDLNLILDAAGDASVPLPATATTREAVNATRGLGNGDEDMAAVIRLLETQPTQRYETTRSHSPIVVLHYATLRFDDCQEARLALQHPLVGLAGVRQRVGFDHRFDVSKGAEFECVLRIPSVA